MEACKEGQWVKVLAVKFDDGLSLIPGSYRVDGESRVLTALQMPRHVQHCPLGFTFSPCLISSSSNESKSSLWPLTHPGHSSHLFAARSWCCWVWVADQLKGFTNCPAVYSRTDFFLFYQKAHLSLYGKLFNNHLKINEKAKCIIFYSSWYTINFLNLDNIFNHTRSHK